MKIKYTIIIEINERQEELMFSFDIKAIEEDGICRPMYEAIEDYIQDTYCTCGFNESQSHCDCDNDYDDYVIIGRELLKDNT